MPELQFHSHDRLKLSVGPPGRICPHGRDGGHRTDRAARHRSTATRASRRNGPREGIPQSILKANSSVTQYGRDPLVEIEHSGVIEKHLAAAGDHFFDHFVDGVIERSGTSPRVGEQAIAFGDKSAGNSKPVSTSSVWHRFSRAARQT